MDFDQLITAIESEGILGDMGWALLMDGRPFDAEAKRAIPVHAWAFEGLLSVILDPATVGPFLDPPRVWEPSSSGSVEDSDSRGPGSPTQMMEVEIMGMVQHVLLIVPRTARLQSVYDHITARGLHRNDFWLSFHGIWVVANDREVLVDYRREMGYFLVSPRLRGTA